MEIYKSIDAIEKMPSLVGYLRVLRRAWEELKVDLVLCVNGAPTLFRVSQETIITSTELSELHKKFWNLGIASVLLVKDPKSVLILSGLVPPQSQNESLTNSSDIHALVATLESLQPSEQDTLFHSVSNGEFYRKYRQKFQADGLVDKQLTLNLSGLRGVICKKNGDAPGLPEDVAHNFICRLLFTCYLVDRGIYHLPGSPRDAREPLYKVLSELPPESAVEYLYDVFRSLKEKFNGSMFDQDLQSERRKIDPHMGRIVSFLKGDEVNSRQPTLGFWAYDFRFIPIETISGIYETFLRGSDRKQNGAYYTPRFLAEMTLDVACEKDPEWDQRRYFDPCCGSGIFVVTLFNRLVTSWEMKNPRVSDDTVYYKKKSEALRSILNEQIRGMDIKPAACTLACFSLYVAYLDSFDPADIETYIQQNHRLPKLLKIDGGSRPDIPVIQQGDSLSTTGLPSMPFDRLIGNPPWGGSGGRGSKDPSLLFTEMADTWLRPGGKACLLLPSKNFLNITTEKKQAQWLVGHTLERVVQLADLRHILFPEAICPCMIVRFEVAPPRTECTPVVYDTPKFDFSSRRAGFVRITAADRKSFSQHELIDAGKKAEAHIFWKKLLWGSPRDLRLLRYLDTFSKLWDMNLKSNGESRWVFGQGVKPETKEHVSKFKKPWWNVDHLYIPGRSPTLRNSYHLLKMDAEEIEERLQRLHRSPLNKDIFTPPLVLVSQGFGKVVFCDFPVLFQDTLQAIHGPPEDEPLLLFLTAYLQSSLARYYCFHTSSKLGIERGVVRFDELKRLPFPLPEDAPAKNAQQIVETVALRLREEKAFLEKTASKHDQEKAHIGWLNLRKKRADALRSEFEPLVFEYFGLLESEQALVLDTVNVFMPSATPSTSDSVDIPTLLPIQEADSVPGYSGGLKTYADTLTSIPNDWAEERKSEWRVNACGSVDPESGRAVVKLEVVPKTKKSIYIEGPKRPDLWSKVYDQFVEKYSQMEFEPQLIGFLGKDFFVLRPQSLVNWTRSQALNDADTFFSQYLQSQHGGNR